MLYLSRETRRLLFWFGVVAVSAFLSGALFPAVFPLRHLSAVLYCAILTAWLLTVHKRILRRRIRRLLIAGAGFLLLLFLLRMCRYDFFPGETAGRMLWYLYYIPFTALPLVSFLAAQDVGGRAGRGTDWLWAVWTVLCAVLASNDLHHALLVFPDPADPDRAVHGWLYGVTAAWMISLTLASFLLLLRRSRLVHVRRLAWIPVLPVAAALVLLLIYSLNGGMALRVGPFGCPLYQIQEVYLLLYVGLWEGCIQIGLIPSNSGYGELFNESTVQAVLADRDGRIVYRSRNALPLTPAQMEEARAGSVLLGEHLRVRGLPVSGGAVYWAEDLTSIHELNRELEEAAERLAGENLLLEAENEITARRTSYETQNRLYDGIALTLRPQLERRAELLRPAEPDRDALARAAVLGAYVKRRANLAVSAGAGGELPAGELYLSVRESMEYLALAGVRGAAAPPPDLSLPAELVCLCYELFQRTVESVLPGLTLLLVSFGGGPGFRMTLCLDREPGPAGGTTAAALADLGARLEAEEEDGVFYLRLLWREEGGP